MHTYFLLSYTIHFVGKYNLDGIKINSCVKTLFQVGLSFQERLQSLLQKYPSVSSATHIEVRKFDLLFA
jgi:hypothetical protein